jgi:trehalose 6-phosphate synthase/phosphatase
MSDNNRKLIIVSNRLPVTVYKSEGKLHFKSSEGGLPTAMSKLTVGRDSLWIGWPGISSDEINDKEKKIIVKELKKFRCLPIFMTQKDLDLFYSGYSNSTLWPLFHYHIQKVEIVEENWKAYKQINQLFTEKTLEFYNDKTDIWVQDYHLMLMPGLIRNKKPDASIGFFMHTPFPSYEVYRLLPQASELLKGLLGSDLIGFHTYDYVRHFLSSVLRSLGHENSLGTINVGDRLVKTDVFPIGIDYSKFSNTAKRQLKTKFKAAISRLGMKVILSIDRTDYSKGIIQRLEAYDKFLADNPNYHGRVVMIMLCVPSRQELEPYQYLREQIEQKISRINGLYSHLGWSPISYRHKAVPFEEIVQLYVMADVMLVTPLRDGMNLVSKEYLASKQNGRGVLILSERTGAASELQEAILVNPNDISMVADAIKQALQMPVKQQKSKLLTMQSRIASYTNEKWAADFINQLQLSKKRQTQLLESLSSDNKKKMLKEFSNAKKRLILLDYDGTLTEFSNDISKDAGYPTFHLKTILGRLAANPRNQIVIISGRTKAMLGEWFRDMNIYLVAEHGSWVKYGRKPWQRGYTPQKGWYNDALKVLEHFADRTPGAKVEKKEFSLVWHYRQVSPDLAYVRKLEVKQELKDLLHGEDVGIFDGDKILEIKPSRIHKGVIAKKLYDEQDWDFVLAVGDDYTDEDMFKVLPKDSYTIKIGIHSTQAKYRLDSAASVRELLQKLVRR